MNNVLLISPSGKLYGSERVLLDFIGSTSLPFDVAVPAKGDLQELLAGMKRNFTIISFDPVRIPLLYSKLFLFFLTGKYKHLYVNEGAHTRYILLLAGFLKNRNFTIHVRILEDTDSHRWALKGKKLPPNVCVITISDYLSKLMPFETVVIPDPFIFDDKKIPVVKYKGIVLNIGIVGRISLSKGIELLPFVIDEIKIRGLNEKFVLHMFGEMGSEVEKSIKYTLVNNKNIILHGYVKDSNIIYENLNVVMHLSEIEPLGRIFFEATNHCLPFIGINAGGIGETARKYKYTKLMAEPADKKSMAIQLVDRLLLVFNDPARYCNDSYNLKGAMKENISIENYCRNLDPLITGDYK